MPDDLKSLKSLNSLEKISEAGEHIYAARYKEQFEREYAGKFVVIDVLTGNAYLGEFAEKAMQEAQQKAPTGLFHLIRVGSPGAFKVSYVSHPHADSSWPF